MDLVVDLAHGAADPLKLRACIIADLILGKDTAVDFCGHQAKRLQLSKKGIQAVSFRVVIVPSSVSLCMAGSLKELADSKEFPTA